MQVAIPFVYLFMCWLVGKDSQKNESQCLMTFSENQKFVQKFTEGEERHKNRSIISEDKNSGEIELRKR